MTLQNTGYIVYKFLKSAFRNSLCTERIEFWHIICNLTKPKQLLYIVRKDMARSYNDISLRS